MNTPDLNPDVDAQLIAAIARLDYLRAVRRARDELRLMVAVQAGVDLSDTAVQRVIATGRIEP